MADKFIQDLVALTTPADVDRTAIVDDPTGTPITKYITLAVLARYFETRPVAVASSGTPTINTDNGRTFIITSLSAAITSMTTNLSGTPVSAQKMMIEILDNGTARAITWGASFASGPGTLPTTTVLSKWLYVGFEWSASRSKWICLAVGSEV